MVEVGLVEVKEMRALWLDGICGQSGGFFHTAT